jgi:HD domain-containing protein
MAIAALVPAFAVAPSSSWNDPVLLVTLTAIALVSLWGLVSIKSAVFLDAGFVSVLLALYFLGPLPAASVWLATEAVYFGLSRKSLVAHLANLASFGWAVLAGALVLDLLGSSYTALALAAVAMLCVNFAVMRGVLGVILNGQRPVTIIREELIKPAPATLVMIAVGVATAFLYEQIGVLALALFSMTIVIPQAVLPVLLRPRPVREIPFQRAVALYACSIADVLELERPDRLVLEDASTFLDNKVFHPVQGSLQNDEFEHWSAVQETLLFYREHWDAVGGSPGALTGELIPLTSRILSVADVWARLTAAESPELAHSEALAILESRAGYHFDPKVVVAASEVVQSQHLTGYGGAAFHPHLHRVPLPRVVARLVAPAIGLG